MASSSLSCQRSSSIPNQFLIELNASGEYKATPSGYQTLHKMIIYDEVASGIFSGRYETPYLRYDGVNTFPLTGMVSGVLSSTSAGVVTGFKIGITGVKSGIVKNIASVQTKLNPSTRIELKTIFEDTNKYLYENEYDGAQILNLIDVNYSNTNGLSTFQKTSREIFREALCCKNFEIGVIKFAGKDNLELFDFTTDETSLINYIENLRPVQKNYPGSAINQALDMAATVNWKSNKTKIVNIISNNKPYIEKNDMYSCCKDDANFPIDIGTEVDEVLDKVTVLRNKNITVNTFVIDGFYESSFALISSSSSRSSSSLQKPQASLSFPSSSSFSDSSCPCSINVTRTSFDCDPCCGIKDAFEDGYKYESLIHSNGLEQVCCPPCPDGYYREDIYYDPEFGCLNCVPIPSQVGDICSPEGSRFGPSAFIACNCELYDWNNYVMAPVMKAGFKEGDSVKNVREYVGNFYATAILLNNGTMISGSYTSENWDVTTNIENIYNVSGIAAGQNYLLALLNDGTVTGWGSGKFNSVNFNGNSRGDSQNFGQLMIPESIQGNVEKIFTQRNSYTHTNFAILKNGNVTGWGSYFHSTLTQEIPQIPIELHNNTKQIEANDVYPLALLKNGRVTGLGYAYGYGDLGLDRIPESIQGNVSKISVGGYNALALLNDGTVTGWGRPYPLLPQELIDIPPICYKNTKDILGGHIANLFILKNGDVTGNGNAYALHKPINFPNLNSFCASSSSSSRKSSSSSRRSSSSSSKSWLSKSSSSFNVIKSSSSSSLTFTTINCEQISREEKCCKAYNKCDSSFAPRGIRCNTSSESFSSCSCVLSSANCPKPCPCSIDDYGINLDLDVDNQQGTCASGPEVVNLKWNITMSDKKYTSKYLPPTDPNSIIPQDNPDYICEKLPISNVVTLSTCRRYPTVCDTFMADDSLLGGKFVTLHPKYLALQLNYVILNLCDGSNIFGRIFSIALSACKAFTQNGTQYLNKDSWSIGVLYGVWGYNIKYWISWDGGILKNEIKEKEIKFGGMIECTDANKDYWTLWYDQKCCCSSSSCDTENDPKCTTTTTTTTTTPPPDPSTGPAGAKIKILNLLTKSKDPI